MPSRYHACLRHAHHYGTLASHASSLYQQGGTALLEGLARFDAERFQFDTAWQWLRTQASGTSPALDDLLITYALATGEIGDVRYHPRTERIPQFEEALAAARRRGRVDAEGILLGNLGLAASDMSEVRRSLDYYEQQLTLARACGDHPGEAHALTGIGNAYLDLGEARRALDFYKQALTIARAQGDRLGESRALGSLGLAYADLGAPARPYATTNRHWL